MQGITQMRITNAFARSKHTCASIVNVLTRMHEVSKRVGGASQRRFEIDHVSNLSPVHDVVLRERMQKINSNVYVQTNCTLHLQIIRFRGARKQRLYMALNAFVMRGVRVCTRKQTRSHANANVVAHECKRVFIIPCMWMVLYIYISVHV